MKGLLVAIEGINGSGKSTIVEGVRARLHDIGRGVRVYKFPDRRGHRGREIDRFLRNQEVFEYKYDMLDAFAANRRAMLEQIFSDLREGLIVICDRYLASGIAYHIPPDASAHIISAYCQVVGYFDKDMPLADITYLIMGRHLHLRQGHKQRFRFENSEAMGLFGTFKKIGPLCSERHVVVPNEQDRLGETITFVIDDILQQY